MEQDATLVLNHMVEFQGKEGKVGLMLNAGDLAAATKLPPNRLNDAVELLEGNGYVELIRSIGSAPFTFMFASPTSRGRFEYQRLKSRNEQPSTGPAAAQQTVVRQPVPVGSPFGFTDIDWEFVENERKRRDVVKVVLGLQFKSPTYDTDKLTKNLTKTFDDAVQAYNSELGHSKVALNFKTLRAGYGEHQFNAIARDVISSDIAVFETSDSNTNVMIEMGVALTWGTRVLPMKQEGKEKPASDISGQTWVDYRDNAASFPDSDHLEKLTGMIRRAMQRKGST
jgi:hypothetical protein